MLRVLGGLFKVDVSGEMAEWFNAHAWKMKNALPHISSHVIQARIYWVL